MNPELEWKLHNLPDSPGCYLMKSRGTIIYVGKAKNLKNRVSQYFHASRSHTPKVLAMVEKVDDFDIMLVDGELEAFTLECNLIKLYRPHYNILLKDDKHYPFIAIDPTAPFPAPELRRKREKDSARYFGPFTGTNVLYEVLDALRAEFPLRVCTKELHPEKPQRPCVHHQIGRCPAPCAALISEEEYRTTVEGAIAFLSGDTKPLIASLQEKMLEASKAMQFEKAALYRDRIRAIEQVMYRQKADADTGNDQDVLAVQYEGQDALVQLLNVREGKLIGSELHVLDGCADEQEGSILLSFILQYYSAERVPPKELLLSVMPEDAATLEELLSELRTGRARVHIKTPVRGEKHHLMELAYKNVREAAAKRRKKLSDSFMRTQGALIELSEVLGIADPPRRIEGFDISNTQGALSVASMVVMIDGVSAHKEYRTFRIKTVQGPNDFESMYEVIHRRLSHGLREREERMQTGLPPEGGSFSELPDCILIDGGPGQLARAQQAMHELGLYIPMFGLAERIEEIVLPDTDVNILLPRSSPALHLIQRLRDEAHRFAITHHRALRGKKSVASQLETIPGIGEKRRIELLRYFKTMDDLKNASVEELNRANGMNRAAAESVYAYFHADAESKENGGN